MKRRIIAALMALCLCIGLLPATALAVEFNQTVTGDYLKAMYNGVSLPTTAHTDITVKVLSPGGEELESLNLQEATRSTPVTLTLISEDYEIDEVTVDNGNAADYSINNSFDEVYFYWTGASDTMGITVSLRDPLPKPDTPEGVYNDGDTIDFRAYYPHLLKLLYLGLGDKSQVKVDTEITEVTVNFVEPFGYGEDTSFIRADREEDYLHYTFSNASGLAVPNNVESLTIASTAGTVTVGAGDLRFVLGYEVGATDGGPYYSIEANNDDLCVVYFYNETTSNNYVPYAVRFVESGQSIGEENMPDPPEYGGNSEFVAWTETYDGGRPFLSSTIVEEDLTVFSQKKDSLSASSEIHVMNDSGLLKERIAELYELNESEIDWGSVKISVYGKTDDNHTNPDYNISPNANGWRGTDGDEYYFVYNYPTGVGDQENDQVYINDIIKIVITAQNSSGKDLGEVTINKGIYDGDFWVSTGSQGSGYITQIFINDNNTPDPDPEPGDDYAITDVTKTLVDTAEKAEAAGISGEYDYPDPVNGNKVIIPEDDTVTLLYAITVEGKPGASFTVTDKDATLVAIDSVAITQTDDTFTGSIPADAASITFYVSKTFDADNLESASEGDGTVLKNTATVAGNADPNEDEDTEETPAEEEQDMISRDVYVYLRVEGTGDGGALTAEEQELVKGWGLTPSEPETYYILGKLSGVELPETITGVAENVNCYNTYQTYIEQAFNGNKFEPYDNYDNKDQINSLLKRIDSWEKLSWAYGAPGYNVESNCLHLDGVLKLESSYDLTYDANGGTIDGKETYTVSDISAAEAKDYSLSKEIVPTHSNDAVVFAGWTLTDTGEKIYSVEDAKNGSVPAAVEAVDLTENDTVYALWSYDEDNDGTPDINEIIVTPADITIYTGGDSYTGEIVDSKGDPVTSGGEDETQDYNGFPEPGFYITLPTALNDQLRGGITGPVNLSEKLSFVYENEATLAAKHWTLQMYNPASGANNIAYNKYIYQLAPAAEQDPVRLLIKDAAGKEQPSDRFEFDVETLYQEYTMTIYGGENVETNEVQAVIEGDTYSVFVDTGDLTVRGVKGEDSTSAVVTEKPEELDKITAVAADDVTYYINESAIPVRDDAEIHLLADELAATPEALVKAAKDAIKAELENPEYDFMYLDLVDSSNGNAYVTMQGTDTVTIHWPIPGDAKEGSAFYVVHFDGLDRDYDVDTELEGLLTDENITVYEKDGTNDLTVSEDGKSVSFETSTFSPFALVYEQKDGTTPVTKYTVTYDANGGKGAMASQTVNAGNSVTIKANTFTRSDHTFTGWNTRADGTGTGYAAGNTITPNSNLTLYAQWKSTGDSGYDPKEATLRFNSRGGTEFEDEVRDNPFRYNPYNKIPTRPGYRFTGWYDSSRLDDRYDEDEEISVPMGITTVWAGWEETSVPSMLNGDDHYAYIQGYSDGTVRPNANITRAQVATIFFRLLDEDVRDDNLTTYNTFPDVDEDYWANTAISTMASLGVINGRNSGLFDPDAYITRAEFAAICARFDDSGVDGITTFTDTVGHWAEDEISRAAALGWIQGYSDGTFRPNQYITRAQAVTMINRVLCRLPEDTDDLLSGMNTWTDCHEDDWFYLAIQEATNSHDFVAKDRVYESWTDLNRAPDWSRYE